MKRQTAIALALSAFFLFAASASGAADIQVTQMQKKVSLQHQPINLHGRTMMAAEDLSRLLHGSWSQQQGMGKLTVGQLTITFKLGTHEVLTKSWQKIEQGAVMQGKTAYLPLRFVAEQLGIPLTWENGKIDIGQAGSPDSFALLASEHATAQDKAFIEQAKRTEGIHKQGNLYVIARGEMPNPGYGIEFVRQQVSWEQVTVYVRLTSPQPGMMYAQQISYPYLAGKINLSPNTSIRFIDVDTGKPLFQE